MEHVVLVDLFDKLVGTSEKYIAHKQGLLHRAVSIIVLNDKNEMLLQQRAFQKYHSGGLWTNACCTHPRLNENALSAAGRRLFEEMGFQAPLFKIFDFVYKCRLPNGLIEFEFDHVFFGRYSNGIAFNPSEVFDFAYKPVSRIENDLDENPSVYTEWFKIMFHIYKKYHNYLCENY